MDKRTCERRVGMENEKGRIKYGMRTDYEVERNGNKERNIGAENELWRRKNV